MGVMDKFLDALHLNNEDEEYDEYDYYDEGEILKGAGRLPSTELLHEARNK